MKKSKFIAAIPVFFAAEGAFLIVYGFVTGANFLAIVNAFSNPSSPLTAKEFYVILGLVRTMVSSHAIKEEKPNETRRTWSERTKITTKRAIMIIAGIFFVFMSIGGAAYGLTIGGITAFDVYVIVIEFILTFILSLSYLIYAFRIKVEPL